MRCVGAFYANKTRLNMRKRPGLLPLLLALMMREYVRCFVFTALQLAAECGYEEPPHPLTNALQTERTLYKDMDVFHRLQLERVLTALQKLFRLLDTATAGVSRKNDLRHVQDALSSPMRKVRELERSLGQDDDWPSTAQDLRHAVQNALSSLRSLGLQTNLEETFIAIEEQSRALKLACASFASVDEGLSQQEARLQQLDALVAKLPRKRGKLAVFWRPDWYQVLCLSQKKDGGRSGSGSGSAAAHAQRSRVGIAASAQGDAGHVRARRADGRGARAAAQARATPN